MKLVRKAGPGLLALALLGAVACGGGDSRPAIDALGRQACFAERDRTLGQGTDAGWAATVRAQYSTNPEIAQAAADFAKDEALVPNEGESELVVACGHAGIRI